MLAVKSALRLRADIELHYRLSLIMDLNVGTKVANELEEIDFADSLGKRLDAGFRG